MKNALRTGFWLTLCIAVLTFAGCAGRSGQGTYNGDGGLPGEGEESIDSTGLPAAARPDGVNPETDLDYSILAGDTVYFAFDSSTVQASERGKLERVAQWLKENSGRTVFLAGHADSRGTLEYNRGLGERRAQAVRDYLAGLGADGSRLSTISYGEERPAKSGESEDAWAANRRVEFGVVKQ